MTAAAVLAKLAIVAVVHGVTAAAIIRQCRLDTGLVTCHAIEVGVTVDQHEAGLAMIEKRVRPVGCLVAGLAFSTVTTLVIVLGPVALDTTAVESVFEILPDVAIEAGQATVSVLQSKAGFDEMVEADILP